MTGKSGPPWISTTQRKRHLHQREDIHTKNREEKEKHKLCHKNQINSGFKEDEKTLKDIIHKNVKLKPGHKIVTIIYYKSKKTSQLVMKNTE